MKRVALIIFALLAGSMAVLVIRAAASESCSESCGQAADAGSPSPQRRRVAAQEGTAKTGTVDEEASRRSALSRMRECGHQWSAMKKSGAAAGMTWKDFSQSCLSKL